MVDCTLACNGGKISAHKVVLSACSSYLANILIEHPVEHPIIILPELNIDDVKTLVHYMYTGELLKSDTQHSTSLLKTAAILSVNSLNDFLSGTMSKTAAATTAPSTPTSNEEDHQNIPDNSHNSHQLQHFAFNATNNGNQSLLAKNGGTLDSRSERRSGSSDGGTTNIGKIRHSGSSILANNTISVGNICNTNNNVQSGNKSEFQFKCPVCENTIRQTICSFEYHMQRVHNVTSFGCEICHKPFASLRYVLTDHMRRCHGWKAEQKLQC